MKVSIIVPAFNAVNTLSDCIATCLQQKLSPHHSLEIVIVDDGSTDGTFNSAIQFTRAENVSIHKHEHNRGLAAARNTGMKAARGEIFVLLDADFTIDENFVASHVKYYKSSDDIIGVTNWMDPGPEIPQNKFTRYLYRSKRGAKSVGEGGTVPPHQIPFSCSSMLSSVFDRVGGFDENITAYGGEDTEYGFRINRKCSGKFVFTKSTKAIHHEQRGLDETCNLLFHYGNEVVPYLESIHPDLAPYLGVQQIDPIHHPWKTLLWRNVLTSNAFLSAIKIYIQIVPYPLVVQGIRFLLGAQVIKGYIKRLEK